MIRSSKFSIKTKLILISLAASLVVLIIFGSGVYFYESRNAFKEKELTAERLSLVTANNLSAALSSKDQSTVREILSIFQTDPDFLAISVFDKTGSALISLPNSSLEQLESLPSDFLTEHSHITRSQSHFDLKTKILVEKQAIGFLILRFSYDSVKEKISEFWGALILSLLVAIALASAVSIKLQGLITKRLLKILDLIQEISSSRDYSLSISDLGSDEIGILGHNFNLMLSEINQRDLSLRLANLSLESRVQERTRQLEVAIKGLEDAQAGMYSKHKQLLAVVSEAPIAMAMLDCELNFIVSSTKWATDYGIDSLDTRQNKFQLSNNAPESWHEAFKEALLGTTSAQAEDSFFSASAEQIFLRWTVQPWWTESGEVGGIIVASENISDLVRARNEALKIAQARTEFLANVSHELRTPLNGIIGFSSILQDNCQNKEQKEYVDLINNSGKVLLRVINDVLDHSKLEQGATQVESIRFSPKDLILDLEKIFILTCENKDIRIESYIGPNIPDFLLGDEFRLKQILSNLIGNAIKFTPNGLILVSLKNVDSSANTRELLFSVKDSGIGIPAEKLETIFKPFSQADGSVTRRFGGTGLGLSIAADLVSLMGGKLRASSAVGQGSEFSFSISLPIDNVAKNQASANSCTPAKTSTNSSKRVLVAEDNPINLKLVEHILEHAGYKVYSVEDGKKAIEAFKQSDFDLVILDLQMPLMGGLEAAIEIRKLIENGGDKIPLVALTAHAFEEDKRKCFAAGMDEFLTKPIDRGSLLEILSKLCAHHPTISTN